MSGKYLLDTNIVVPLLNRDPKLLEYVEHADEIYISSIVLGELYFGAHRSTKINENINKIQVFKQRYNILLCGDETARVYGQIKQQLLKKGRPIPENDIWIAAASLQYQLPLVTRDEHFTVIDGLTLEKW